MTKKKTEPKLRHDADGFPLDPANPLYDCHLALANYIKEAARAPKPRGYGDKIDPKETSTGAKILGYAPEEQLRYLTAVVDRLLRAIRFVSEDNTGIDEEDIGGIRFISYSEVADRAVRLNLLRSRSLFSLALGLLRRKLPYR